MDPPFTATQVIDLEINNGCLADVMTNTGDWVDSEDPWTGGSMTSGSSGE